MKSMKKEKPMQIEDLAVMVQRGFNQVDEQFNGVHVELSAIRKQLTGVIYRREFDELEERVKELEDMLAMPKRKTAA